jgi:replication factor C subunit 3/5
MNDSQKPWVEKYRPTNFDDIVLDDINKNILHNILNSNSFPNLLLYGPPGTGKTTTIINLVNKFHSKQNQNNKSLTIHLNASDERGIDIIRNQINQFVNSKNLFVSGTKLVILDEVDYMTKNAQQALKYLLRSINNNVRFCLICNYITRIDESLQNEFMRLRFNQLPQKDIIKFLKNINDRENLDFSDNMLISIQQLYKSDIRSMINYMQSNHNIKISQNVIDNKIWRELTKMFLNPVSNTNNITTYIDGIIGTYNIDEKNLIKDYLNYIIRYEIKYINAELLKCMEFIIHISSNDNRYLITYFICRMREILSE